MLQSDPNSFALDFLNIYEAPVAYDPAVTVDIMLDDRMIGTANAANDWALPLPSAASGQHALTCRVTSATSLHYGEASAWIKA